MQQGSAQIAHLRCGGPVTLPWLGLGPAAVAAGCPGRPMPGQLARNLDGQPPEPKRAAGAEWRRGDGGILFGALTVTPGRHAGARIIGFPQLEG